MPLEEILVDGDVLDRHEPAPGLVLGDASTSGDGIAVAEPVDGGRWMLIEALMTRNS